MVTLTKQRGFARVDSVYTTGPDSSTRTIISAGSMSWTDDKNGGQNPRWREQVKLHQNATTGFSGTRFSILGNISGLAETKYVEKPGTQATNDSILRRVAGDILDVGDIPLLNLYTNVPMRSRVVNRALSVFYNKAWKAIRQFQGGVFLGEVREALALIRNPARSFRRGLNTYSSDVNRRLRRIRRGRPRTDPVYISDANKVVSDTWLEYAFGWRPLFSDVESGAQALARLALDPNEYIKVSAYEEEFAEEVIPSQQRFYTKQLNNWIVYRVSQRGKVGYQCRFLGEVRCTIDSPLTMSSEVLGVSPEDFLPTVWELIPYSFLVDYFTNIGDVISAWSFPRSKVAWHCRTIRSVAERDILASRQPSTNPDPGKYVLDYENGPDLNVRCERTGVERDGTSLGLPTVALELPGSSLKWLNIAALVHMRRPSD